MFPQKYITIDSSDIAYTDEGTGSPILFIHGIPTSSYLWRHLIKILMKTNRCLAPDLLGLGHSRGPVEENYTMPAHARRLVRLLDALKIDKVTVVAHDQGGAAGQILATRHQDRVEHLVLMNCVCYDNWPVPIIKLLMFLGHLDPLTRPLEKTPLFKWWAHSRFGLRLGVHVPHKLSGEAIDSYIAPLMATHDSRQRFKRFLLAGHERYTVEAAKDFRYFTKPTLIIWAENDRFLPMKWAHRLASDFPDSKLATISNAGHFLQEERPDEIARIIGNFLSGKK